MKHMEQPYPHKNVADEARGSKHRKHAVRRCTAPRIITRQPHRAREEMQSIQPNIEDLLQIRDIFEIAPSNSRFAP